MKLNSDNNFLIIIILYFFLYFYKNKLCLFFFLIFLDVNFLNFYTNIFDINKDYININSRLTNGLILIHPLLLYIGLIKFIFFSVNKVKIYFFSKLFFFTTNINFYKLYTIFLYICLSIFLGSV